MTNKEILENLEAYRQVYRFPHVLLEAEFHMSYAFCISHEPCESHSNEEPPIKLGRKSDVFPIDNLLGLYNPNTQEITIFDKGIEEVARRLRVRPKHLEHIVRIHEWAHAFFHIGFTKDERHRILDNESSWEIYLRDSTKLFKKIDSELHESLAQLLTLYCVRRIKKEANIELAKLAAEQIEKTFYLLQSHQPRDYQIDDFINVPPDRVIKSFGLIKNRLLVGKADAWRSILTW